MYPPVPYSSVRALVALFATLPAIASAATLTWDGNGAADTGGAWSLAANWSDDTVPGASDTAVLGNVSEGMRTLAYDAAAPGSLASLVFAQTGADAINLLSVQRSLTIANPITLGAEAGIARITVAAPSSSGTNTLTATGGLTLGANGVLAFSGGNAVFGNFTGALTVAGGTLLVSGSTHTSSTTNLLTGALTMSSGSIVIENAGTAGQTQADRRLTITGDVNITGGTISSTRNGVSGMLTLSGTNLVFNPASFDNDITLTLDRNGAQNLTTGNTLTGPLLLRGTGVKTITHTGGGSVGALSFIDGSTSSSVATTLKLGSDLTLAGGAAQPIAANFSQSIDGAGAIQVGIDAAGHALDLRAGANGGVWTPAKSAQATVTTTVWTLSNSGAAGSGKIIANAFDLSAAGSVTHVEAGLVLEARGGDGSATHLGAAGVFDSTATFIYAGDAAAAAPATLASGRTIGALRVESGALKITGDAFAAAGGIAVAAGARLDFTTQTVSAGLTLGLNGASAGQIAALGDYAFGGALVLDFASATVAGTYDLFDFTTTRAAGSDFASVTLSGLYSADLVLADGVWRGSAGGFDFSFSQITGDLLVTSTIPEPSAFALLAGFATLAAVVQRRRR